MTEIGETSFEQRDNQGVVPPSPKVSLTELTLSGDQQFPLELDFQAQMEVLLGSGTLKQIEHPALRHQVTTALRDERVQKMCRVALEIVLVTKYPKVLKSPAYLIALKQRLSKQYVKFFAKLPQPKDEIVNYVIFICTYNIHWMIWKVCKDQREEMDLRFVFDCYHIMIFCLNGIYVSDSFIRVQIEKIFSSKFMDYEREKKEKLILQKLEKKKKNTERTFMGHKIDFPDIGQIRGGHDFTKQLNDRFKNKKAGQFFSQPLEDGQMRIDTSKMNSQANEEDKSKQAKNIGEIKILLQNLQLNVNQVSPSVSHVLQMSKMQLPFSRKKMLSHTFEKNEDNSEGILNLLKEMTQQRKQKKDPKQVKKYQKTLIEIYDLRAPGKEYFQKHQKVDTLFKDMLELNYVLMNQQETLNSLYSTKELKKNLEDPPDDNYDPATMSPQKRLMLYLQNRQPHTQSHQFLGTLMPTEAYTASPESKLGQSLLFPPLAEPDKAAPRGKEIKTQGDELPEKGHRFSSQVKLKEEFYMNKNKQYREKYDPIVNRESTDSKITSIVNNIQVKQHLIGKSLSKKIHKM